MIEETLVLFKNIRNSDYDKSLKGYKKSGGFIALKKALKMKPEEIENLETRLNQVFDKSPFFVENLTLKLEAELGRSIFPEDGENLCELAALAWARTSNKVSFVDDKKMVE